MEIPMLDNRQADYLTTLAEMEQNWQSAVDKALSVREDQLATAKHVIDTLRSQVEQLETQLAEKSKDIDILKRTLLETQIHLESTREDMTMVLESSQRQLEEQRLEHKRQLEAKDRETDDLRTRQKLSIQELARGARDTLQELEAQLDSVKLSEVEWQRQLEEAREVSKGQQRRLEEWDRVSDKMCHELDDVKGKLKSSKFANGKLREEIALWKKYAEKVEEERKTLRREVELEKKVLQKFSQVDSFLRSERQHRNIIMNSMNNFGMKLMSDLRHCYQRKERKVILASAGTQTDVPDDWEEKMEIIDILERKGVILEDELKKKENDMEILSAQNATLREVILKMKKEREMREREREQMDEEARVSKLEESVRLIKNNLINEQKDVCVWSALQGVKKEMSDLKNRKVHNATMPNTMSMRPTVVAKPVMKATGGIPVLKEYVVNRGKMPVKF